MSLRLQSLSKLISFSIRIDPVQKAILHHTLGIPPTAKRKHVSCSVCRLRFNSQVSKPNINSPPNELLEA
ncbi:hypothetical protein AMECASPLE_032274 [Ameca splendens]|uniref:Uncharacterized protein n=1 Tax=Ameca splendens TaxID=208324 RepID=A0ABV1AFJ3_9TELE